MSVRTLFIDDDPRALADFERLASTVGHDIDSSFAPTFAGGLRMLADRRHDVVVLGAGPAGTASRLMALADEHPRVRRLLVTTDRDAARSRLAHQYLWRPFDAERLRVSLLATRHLGDRVSAARLAEVSRGDLRLPSLPDVYLAIQEEIRSADPSMERIGRIITADPAISVKVLQIVNSALYGLRNEIGDIGQAANLLGMNTLSSLVLAGGVFRQAEGLGRRLVEGLWQQSLKVAGLARRIALEVDLPRAQVEAAQLGGLLHDLGDIILYQNWPREFVEVDMARRLEDEHSRFGLTHADAGGYLAALWGLPSVVVGAVANHHRPSFDQADAPTATSVVHVAHAVVVSGFDLHRADLDHDHLAAIGWTDAVDGFSRLRVA
jgi:HD-like signal output (HDOD) protein